MLARFFVGLAVMLALASSAYAQTDPAGHWEGTFNAGDRQIGLSLDLARNAKSAWVASMGVPSEHAAGLVVMDVAVNGASVKFVAVELMMARFDLTLTADGTLKGTFTNGQQPPATIEFTRTGEAKVELIAPSPAVSKDLEGDWEGSLQMGPQAFPIVVHLRNQADNTVSATMDSPARNAMSVPLNDVRQQGSTVQFGVRIAHSSFQGTLNKEGTELAGQWKHEETSVPFTLRKK